MSSYYRQQAIKCFVMRKYKSKKQLKNMVIFLLSLQASNMRPSSHIIYAVHLSLLEHKTCHHIFQYLDDLSSLTTNFTIHICVVKHKLVLIVMF